VYSYARSRNLLNCVRARPKSAIQKESFTFGRDLWPKYANRIPRPKGVGLVVQANVKVTSRRLDDYIEIRNREWSFGSNRVKVGRGRLWSDQSSSWTQQLFLTATECSRTRDRNFSKNFAREHANAPTISSVSLSKSRIHTLVNFPLTVTWLCLPYKPTMRHKLCQVSNLNQPHPSPSPHFSHGLWFVS